MPRDIIITSPQKPEPDDIIQAAASVNPDLRIRTILGRSATQIIDDDTVILTINTPQYLQSPGETTRLLPGARIVNPPCWHLPGDSPPPRWAHPV